MMTSNLSDALSSGTEKQPRNTETANSRSSRPPRAALPVLQDLVAAICRDARDHSLQYVVRSNVGHDGE